MFSQWEHCIHSTTDTSTLMMFLILREYSQSLESFLDAFDTVSIINQIFGHDSVSFDTIFQSCSHVFEIFLQMQNIWWIHTCSCNENKEKMGLTALFAPIFMPSPLDLFGIPLREDPNVLKNQDVVSKDFEVDFTLSLELCACSF